MIKPVWWQDGAVHFIDQRVLPNEEKTFVAESVEQVEEAIRTMVVRGAPAIGISAAYGFVLAWLETTGRQPDFHAKLDHLAQARPTAVNLLHGLKFMQEKLRRYGETDLPPERMGELLLSEAIGYHETDINQNIEMGKWGATLFKEREKGVRVLTYCNTGSLATGGYGTALGVIRALHEEGRLAHVYACETRPFLQGARLTAYELAKDHLPYTLITDNMVAWLFVNDPVDAIVVGADRIAANGDTANKIGTLQLAILAREFNIPFYIAAPTATIDPEIESGDGIPVEERSHDEVFGHRDMRWAPEGANAWNPAFDVTPHRYIQAIITENGVINPSEIRADSLVE